MAVRWEQLEGIMALAVQESLPGREAHHVAAWPLSDQIGIGQAQGIDGSRSGVRERIITTWSYAGIAYTGSRNAWEQPSKIAYGRRVSWLEPIG